MVDDVADFLDCLVNGGDDRLALDPKSRLNMYGYGPVPRPDDLAFSSSTASTVSQRGFVAAFRAFERIHIGRETETEETLYAQETGALRHRLRSVFGIDHTQTDVVLAASGTDLHLIVAALVAGRYRQPVLTLALTASETGSGVALASAGRHSTSHPQSGRAVAKGATLSDRLQLTSQAFDVRTSAGELRSEAHILEDLESRISASVDAGIHCILVATDVSKTGLIAPGLSTVIALKDRFGDRITVLIDACQLRVAPETIRAYLAQDWLVAVTGSKFVAGPIFSGALLVPDTLVDAFKAVTLDQTLDDYSLAGDWPTGWNAASTLPKKANFGLVLRWQAALVELEAMLAHHPLKLGWVMLRFADAVEARLRADSRFELLPGRRLDRSALGLDACFDQTRTIFPFLLRRGGKILAANEMAAIYRYLAGGGLTGSTCVRLGQPVAVGMHAGTDISALRLCLSAPLVERACENDRALDALIADAMTALDLVAEQAEVRSSRVA